MQQNRILIMDDEPEFCAFVKHVAERTGAQVETVTGEWENFQHAIKIFDPTIVILDLVMPEKEGLEVIEWLGARRCQAKIIIVTGYNPDYLRFGEVIGNANGLNIVATLNKPISLSTLRQALV